MEPIIYSNEGMMTIGGCSGPIPEEPCSECNPEAWRDPRCQVLVEPPESMYLNLTGPSNTGSPSCVCIKAPCDCPGSGAGGGPRMQQGFDVFRLLLLLFVVYWIWRMAKS